MLRFVVRHLAAKIRMLEILFSIALSHELEASMDGDRCEPTALLRLLFSCFSSSL
jgi:hypothetical protein